MFEIIEEWKNRNLKNYLRKTNIVVFDNKKYILTKENIQTIINWLQSEEASRQRKRLLRMSVPDALKMSKIWTEKMNRKKYRLNLLAETDKIMELHNGFFVVKLKTKKSYEIEGDDMLNCVDTFFDRTDSVIYSLRDKFNHPHCTIEIRDKIVYQIKGKLNNSVPKKYHPYIYEFLNSFDFDYIEPYDLEKIKALSFGNFLINKNSCTNSLTINKSFVLHEDPPKKFNNVVVKSDVFIKNEISKPFADKLCIHGDLIIKKNQNIANLAKEVIVQGRVINE